MSIVYDYPAIAMGLKRLEAERNSELGICSDEIELTGVASDQIKYSIHSGTEDVVYITHPPTTAHVKSVTILQSGGGYVLTSAPNSNSVQTVKQDTVSVSCDDDGIADGDDTADIFDDAYMIYSLPTSVDGN